MKIFLYTVSVIALTAIIGIIGSRWGDKRSAREGREQDKVEADQ